MDVRLKQIYDRIPEMECIPGCTDCCGPNLWAKAEWQNITNWLKAHGRRERYAQGLDCPYIRENKCSIYEVRPIICRLFGVTEKLACPCGRGPAKMLSDDKARELIHAVWNMPVAREGKEESSPLKEETT